MRAGWCGEAHGNHRAVGARLSRNAAAAVATTVGTAPSACPVSRISGAREQGRCRRPPSPPRHPNGPQRGDEACTPPRCRPDAATAYGQRRQKATAGRRMVSTPCRRSARRGTAVAPLYRCRRRCTAVAAAAAAAVARTSRRTGSSGRQRRNTATRCAGGDSLGRPSPPQCAATATVGEQQQPRARPGGSRHRHRRRRRRHRQICCSNRVPTRDQPLPPPAATPAAPPATVAAESAATGLRSASTTALFYLVRATVHASPTTPRCDEVPLTQHHHRPTTTNTPSDTIRRYSRHHRRAAGHHRRRTVAGGQGGGSGNGAGGGGWTKDGT